MAFFLLCFYFVVLLIRPQDLLGMSDQPVIIYSYCLLLIPFLLANKNKGSPQIGLLIFLSFIVIISAIANGWAGSISRLIPSLLTNLIIPYILFSKIVDTKEKHKTVMFVMCLSTIPMVFNGVVQSNSDTGEGWGGSVISQGTRITYLGTLSDPNDLGLYFVMCLPMMCFFLNRAKHIDKLFWVAMNLMLLYGIYLTNSRGALLGVLALGGFWGFKKYGLKKLITIGVLILPIIAVLMAKFRKIDAQEESAHGRIESWYSGFQMFFQNPLFGVGMDNYMEHHFLTAHNSYVLILAELGVLGFTAWIIFIIISMMMLYRVAYGEIVGLSGENINVAEDYNEFNAIRQSFQDEIALARVSFFSLIGYVVTAFFLSRSYSFFLYFNAGLGVSGYYRTLMLTTQLKPVIFYDLIVRLVLFSLASLIVLYLVVRFLS